MNKVIRLRYKILKLIKSSLLHLQQHKENNIKSLLSYIKNLKSKIFLKSLV